MGSLTGPEESKEPMAIEALERGEYSSEPLLEEEYGDGGKSWDGGYGVCLSEGERERQRLEGGRE